MTEPKTFYKIIIGDEVRIVSELETATHQGWKPIFLSSVHVPISPTGHGHVVITIILERVVV